MLFRVSSGGWTSVRVGVVEGRKGGSGREWSRKRRKPSGRVRTRQGKKCAPNPSANSRRRPRPARPPHPTANLPQGRRKLCLGYVLAYTFLTVGPISTALLRSGTLRGAAAAYGTNYVSRRALVADCVLPGNLRGDSEHQAKNEPKKMKSSARDAPCPNSTLTPGCAALVHWRSDVRGRHRCRAVPHEVSCSWAGLDSVAVVTVSVCTTHAAPRSQETSGQIVLRLC